MNQSIPDTIPCSSRLNAGRGRARRALGFAPMCVLLALGIALGLPLAARGAGTVTNASLGSLNAALAGGGTVVCAFDGVITLTNTFTIAQDTTLDGTGHQVTIDGNNQVRLFVVNTNVTLTLAHVTLTRGMAAGSPTNGATGNPGRGGAIENDGGTVVAQDCTFATNTALGGVAGADGGTGGVGSGGDIFNQDGVVNLTNVTVLASQAVGGDAYGNPPASTSTGGRAAGGSIFSDGGLVNLVGCKFSGCETTRGAPGLVSGGWPYGAINAAYGGALYMRNGALTCSNCVFSDDSCAERVLAFGGAAVGPAAGGAIYVESGTANLIACSFVGNQADGFTDQFASDGIGGAIFNSGTLSLNQCLLISNTCVGGVSVEPGTPPPLANNGSGGAAYNLGTLSAVDCMFLSNTATGGWVTNYYPWPLPSGFSVQAGGPGRGGGLYSSNTATLTRCCFADNQAIGADGVPPNGAGGLGAGGGIYVAGGTVTLINATCSGNLAVGGRGANFDGGAGGDGAGGAIFSTGATVPLINVTMAGNNAVAGAGGLNTVGGTNGPVGNANGGSLYTDTSSAVTLRNTIVTHNSTNSSPGNAIGV